VSELSRARSENKALVVHFLGALMIITGAAMAAARQRVEINAAGRAAVVAGSIAALGGMMKYIRT